MARLAPRIVAATLLLAGAAALTVVTSPRDATSPPPSTPGSAPPLRRPLAQPTPQPLAFAPHDRCSVVVSDIFGGYVTATLTLGDRAVESTDAEGHWDHDVDETVQDGMRIHVAAPGYVSSVVLLRCPGPITVALTPASAITGRVIDESGPVRDVDVRAGEHQATLDSGGNFVLEGLPPGDYRLEARSHGRYGESDTPLRVGLGEIRSGVELSLRPAIRLRGVVRAGDQAVGEGIHVGIAHRDAVTDADGAFTLDGLAIGVHTLALRGSAMTYPLLYHEERVVLRAGDNEINVDIGPRSGLTVSVVDPSGGPIEDATIVVEWHRGSRIANRPCRTGADGRCRLGGMEPGQAHVRLDVIGGAAVSRPVEAPFDREIELATSQPVARLLGAVQDVADRPAAGRRIVLRRLDGAGGAVATTDDVGGFAFAPVAFGSYRVEVLRATDLDRIEESTEIEIDEDRERVTLTLLSTTTPLRGVVYDPVGIPVAGALVQAMPADAGEICWVRAATGANTMLTDLDGHFEGTSHVSDILVTATHTSRGTGFALVQGAEHLGDIVVRLHPLGGLRLVHRAPVEGCWATLRRGACVLRAVRLLGDETRVTDLPADMGPLDLSVDCPGLTSTSRTFDIQPGEERTIDMDSE